MAKNELDNIALSAFCGSMAMMLRSGIQTDEAVSLMLEDSGEGQLGRALEKLHGALESGDTLTGAVSSTGMFPEYTVRMISMGERTGRLESTLKSLAGYYDRQQLFSQRLANSIRYPAIIMAIISAVLAIMLAWVLPVFTGVYERLTGSLGASSYSYIAWSKGLCLAALIIMLALIVMIVIFSVLWKTERGQAAARSALCVIPRFRAAVRDSELCKFFSIFILMLSGGADEDSAAAEAQSVVKYRKVTGMIDKCRGKMAEGLGFAQAAHDTRLLKPEYGRLLLAGERSGDADGALERVSQQLENDYCGNLEDILSVAEPVLSGTMLFVVGFALTSVMLPLIGIMNTIG